MPPTPSTRPETRTSNSWTLIRRYAARRPVRAAPLARPAAPPVKSSCTHTSGTLRSAAVSPRCQPCTERFCPSCSAAISSLTAAATVREPQHLPTPRSLTPPAPTSALTWAAAAWCGPRYLSSSATRPRYSAPHARPQSVPSLSIRRCHFADAATTAVHSPTASAHGTTPSSATASSAGRIPTDPRRLSHQRCSHSSGRDNPRPAMARRQTRHPRLTYRLDGYCSPARAAARRVRARYRLTPCRWMFCLGTGRATACGASSLPRCKGCPSTPRTGRPWPVNGSSAAGQDASTARAPLTPPAAPPAAVRRLHRPSTDVFIYLTSMVLTTLNWCPTRVFRRRLLNVLYTLATRRLQSARRSSLLRLPCS